MYQYAAFEIIDVLRISLPKYFAAEAMRDGELGRFPQCPPSIDASYHEFRHAESRHQIHASMIDERGFIVRL